MLVLISLALFFVLPKILNFPNLLLVFSKEKPKANQKKVSNEFFANDIIFSGQKNYALVIDHIDHGLFLIRNLDAIKKIKIKWSLLNLFPGEGKKDYGTWLYENNSLMKSSTGGHFKVFEIGDSLKYKEPIERKYLSIDHRNFKLKYQELAENPLIFLDKKYFDFTDFNPSYDHTFQIELPLLMTSQDPILSPSSEIENKLLVERTKAQIKNLIIGIDSYKLDVDIRNNRIEFYKSRKISNMDKFVSVPSPLGIKGVVFYTRRFDFNCSEDICLKLAAYLKNFPSKVDDELIKKFKQELKDQLKDVLNNDDSNEYIQIAADEFKEENYVSKPEKITHEIQYFQTKSER